MVSTVLTVQRLYPVEYYQHEVVISALNKICRWETSILDYYQKVVVSTRYVEALITHFSDCALFSLFCIWKTQCPSLVDVSCNFVVVSSFKNTKHYISLFIFIVIFICSHSLRFRFRCIPNVWKLEQGALKLHLIAKVNILSNNYSFDGILILAEKCRSNVA